MVKSLALVLLPTVTLLGCTSSVSSSPARAPAPPESAVRAAVAEPRVTYDDAGLELFRERGVTGSFVLLDVASGKSTIVGKDDADTPWLPCSTFKIPNTLIGLETGVIPDEHFAQKWDGVTRQYEVWNRDQDLRSALQNSVVWFYQEVARRVGQDRMGDWVHRLGYGNEDIGGGIDHFWLDERGALRITPRAQVEFLRRLDAGELPVAKAHAELVKRLLSSETVGGATLRHKTGMGVSEGHGVGWIVGYVEKDGRTWVYATHLDAPPEDLERIMPLRKELTVALLRRRGVIAAP